MLSQIHASPDLVEQVYETLLEAICAGDLAPGQRFTQEALAERLGVSRQPVLQALLLLRQQGVIRDTDNRRGVLVAALDASFARALYAVRASLDGLAAHCAAQRAQAELEAAGRALVREGRQACASGDLRALVRLDLAFHQLIYEASGNPVLVDTARLHRPHTQRVMASFLRNPSIDRVWDEHEAILEAIVRADAPAAEHLAREHARRSSEMLFGTDDSPHPSSTQYTPAQRRHKA